MQCPFGEGWGWGCQSASRLGHCGCSFSVGEKFNVVGKRLQESRALVEGLMANLGEDGEGKPAALKHGDAARAALWRQVLLLAKIPQPMAGRMKAAKSTEPYHDPAKAKVVAGNITFPSFMRPRGLVPLRGVGQRLTNPWRKQEAGGGAAPHKSLAKTRGGGWGSAPQTLDEKQEAGLAVVA